MALVSEVIAVSGVILETLAKIQGAQEVWCTPSEDYQSNVEALRARHDFYAAQIRIHGLCAGDIVVDTLRKAEGSLKREESELLDLDESINNSKCCGWAWWPWGDLKMTLSRQRIERTIKRVIDQLDKIPANLKMEEELSSLFEQWSKRQAMPIITHNNDNLYVPIGKPQSAVIAAIEKPEGPCVILLHGGVGTGKSTLARYVSQRYGKIGEKGGLFELVITVTCGSRSTRDVATKQFEILQSTAPTSVNSSPEGNESGIERKIAAALQGFIRGKKLLIILDDVSDQSFLLKMLEAAQGGADVKILVTSRSFNLCDSLSQCSERIAMESPTKDEARKILASLAGLDGKSIPVKLQELADKMIAVTERNPLALACLATYFAYSSDKKEKKAWQEAYSGLSELVQEKQAKIVLGQVDGTAPKSLWASMKLCLDSLENEDAKRILVLMYACEGSSVPEEVLKILHEVTRKSKSLFIRSQKELEMRELLKPSPDTVASETNFKRDDKEDEMQVSRQWSLGSLVKLYMENNNAGGGEIKSVMDSLVANEIENQSYNPSTQADRTTTVESESEKARVAISLCALYFDGNHLDQVVKNAATRARAASDVKFSSKSTTDLLRRRAIRPIIRLLAQPLEYNQWTESGLHCARKVFLTYVCEGQLDDDEVSALLQLVDYPSAPLATLTTLRDICSIEESPLFGENTKNMFRALARLLDAKAVVPTSIQEAAYEAMVNLSWKFGTDKSTVLVCRTPGILEGLVSLLQNSQASTTMQAHAVNSLSNLAGGEEEGKVIIINHSGALEVLVKSLWKEDDCLPQAAARALQNLSSTESDWIKMKIVDWDQALAGLFKLFSLNDKPSLQERAAGALANLSAATEPSVRMKIVDQKGALEGFVMALAQHQNPTLRQRAAGALKYLSRGMDSLDTEIKRKIVDHDRVLEALVKPFSEQDNNISLQQQAAGTLRNLAFLSSSSIISRIANQDGAIAGLVKSLSENRQPGLQLRAVWALLYLALDEDDTIKMKIVNEDGALTALVNLMSTDDQPELQEIAARTIGFLAEGRNARASMAGSGEFLDALSGLLSKPTSPDMQGWAESLLDVVTNPSVKSTSDGTDSEERQ